MAYLKVEKPRFLFLEGSTGAEAAADVATVALPDASAARAGTSAACDTSSVDLPAAGASAPAPGACSFSASAALGEEGASSHLSTGARPPSLSSSSSSPDDESSDVAGGKPLLLAQPEFFVPSLSALLPLNPPLLLTRRPLLFPPLSCARALARGVGGSDCAAFTATLC
jgi:hypothetical protein